MFSGITRGLFPVTAISHQPGLMTYTVQLSADLIENLTIGASVAINGVCQTVIQCEGHYVTFQAIAETLANTTLASLAVGQTVSVEPSLRYGDPVGGHEVSGHVMGTVAVSKITTQANQLTLTVQCPAAWMKYLFHKGFVALDGSSLTIAHIDEIQQTFDVCLIPETLRVTQLGNKKVGDKINLEWDTKTQVIVETVERLVLRDDANASPQDER